MMTRYAKVFQHNGYVHAAREIAGRSPSAVRGAKQLINRISNAGAAEHFAAEREIIFTLIGKPHQVEAITANFENRPAKFTDMM